MRMREPWGRSFRHSTRKSSPVISGIRWSEMMTEKSRLLDQREGLDGAGAAHDVEFLALEGGLEAREDDGLVLDDQDGRRGRFAAHELIAAGAAAALGSNCRTRKAATRSSGRIAWAAPFSQAARGMP